MQVTLEARTIPVNPEITTEDFTAFIARIGKIKENPTRLLKYLIRNAHWSPFEHTYFTFKIITSRDIGRQLLRHRSFTFQELSQRYEEITKLEPIEIRKQAEDNRQSSTEIFDPVINTIIEVDDSYTMPASVAIAEYLEMGRMLYQDLLSAGVARECARGILPGCTQSELLMTGNIRSWLHFLQVRLDPHAQKEAQEISSEVKDILMKEIPVIIQAFYEKS